MIRRALILFSLFAAGIYSVGGQSTVTPNSTLTAPSTAGPSGPAAGTRFAMTRAHIDALFRYRDRPLPPPESNPFRDLAEGPVNTISGPNPTSNNAAESDDSILARAVTTLKIGGYVVMDGKAALTINRRPYREGDTILAGANGSRIGLRIRRITSNSVTFALNQAESTIKF